MVTTAEDARGLVKSIALSAGWTIIASEAVTAATPHLIVAPPVEHPTRSAIQCIWVKGGGRELTKAQHAIRSVIDMTTAGTVVITSDTDGLKTAMSLFFPEGIRGGSVDVGDES